MVIRVKNIDNLNLETLINPSLLQYLQEGIFLVNKKREIISWNQKAEEITTLKSENVLGKFCNLGPFKHLNLDGNAICENNCPLKECIESGKQIKRSVAISINNNNIPVITYNIPIKDYSNKTIGAVQLFLIDQEKESIKTTYNKVKDKIEEYRSIIVDLVNKNKQLNKQLLDLSNTDGLTSLYNRRYFYTEAKKEFEAAKICSHSISIILLDIDHFKLINDNFGHSAGDHVLIKIASVLKDNKGRNDLLCRYGGEEFILLLPDSSSKQAYLTSEILRNKVEDENVQYDGNTIPITISLGVACNEDKPYLSLEHLIDCADKALYKAKNEGRNRTVVTYDL
ncbi:MAG: diguanylate cyclase [Cyanobacteriota bacterium]